MKILLLGGTGAMGLYLTKIMEQKSNEIYITSRSIRNNSNNVHYIQGNALDRSFLNTLLEQKWDCIVDFMIYNTEMFKERINDILAATKQYIFLSSARVYANSDKPICESSPRLLDVIQDIDFLRTDEYSLTKARQENILMNNKKKNWTIVRPYITYGEQRFQLGVFEKEEWLYLALYAGVIIFSKDISTKTTTLTSGYDVAKAIACLISNESAYGEIYHITGNNSKITWNEVLDLYKNTIERVIGKKLKVIMEDECYRIKNDYTKYQVLYDRRYNRIFDNSKINQIIDTSSFSSPQESLQKYLEEWLKKPVFINNILGEGIVRAIKQYKIRIPIKNISNYKQKIKYILIKMHLL